MVDTNEYVCFVEVGVRRNFQIFGGGTLSDSSGGVVMATVARAEPTLVISSSVSNRYATQMSAYTKEDEELWLLCSGGIGLGISQTGNVYAIGFFNLFSGSVADKEGLSSPVQNKAFPLVYSTQINFDVGYGQHILGCRQAAQGIYKA